MDKVMDNFTGTGISQELFERTLQYYKECCIYRNIEFQKPDINLSSIERYEKTFIVVLANTTGEFYKRFYRKENLN